MIGTCYNCGKMTELDKYWTCNRAKCQADMKEQRKYDAKQNKISIYRRPVKGSNIFSNDFTGLFSIRKARGGR